MNLEVLDGFLEMLPAGLCAAFEFRHKSWLEADVFSRLQAKGLALCVADSEKFSTPGRNHRRLCIFPPARRRLPARRHRALGAGDSRARPRGCSEVFVYFKHEEAGIGTEFAKQLIKNLSG